MLQFCHRNHLLHDLVNRLFLRSLQYVIVVLGFLDAFVYAHPPILSIVKIPRILEIFVIA